VSKNPLKRKDTVSQFGTNNVGVKERKRDPMALDDID